MNRLQLSNQLQNQCNNIEIAFAGADMILIVHFYVWPENRPLGFKGLKQESSIIAGGAIICICNLLSTITEYEAFETKINMYGMLCN